MKRILFSGLLLSLLTCGVIACTEGLPTDNWGETDSPTDPPATTGLNASFESKFVRYYKGRQHDAQAAEEKKLTLWKDTLWLNDRTHKQIVLWSGDKNYSNLTYQVSDLTSGANSISASNIQLRFPSYIKGDEKALECASYESHNTVLIADALSEEPVTTLTTHDPVKIWVTVNTPANAVPGIYTGTITVTSEEGDKQTLNMELYVTGHHLPDVADWNFHLDLWQFPFQLTTLCNANSETVEPFSEPYFAMMKPFYQMLADAGQKAITTYIKDGAFNIGQTMVKWSKDESGEWAFGYTDASGQGQTLELTIGSDEFNSVWSTFLTSFKTHLKAKGWFDKAVLYMDEINDAQMKSVVALVKENDANWKIGLSGTGRNGGEVEAALYDYSIILGYSRQSANTISTFYTSCTQQFPNNYVTAETNPAEMICVEIYFPNLPKDTFWKSLRKE